MNKSGFFKWTKSNVVKALVMTIIGSIVMALAPFVTDGSGKTVFDITTSDLIGAFKNGIQVGAIYLFTTLWTNNQGKFFKKDA